ncbi:MAG: CBS domain-containing protein [Bradyrhizobiaceae bacterium]|nr:MAG: CBS domain-containing protein [Bradyrhizobiaceae bacterium]
MTRTVKTVTRDMTMRELQAMFAADDFNAYPVRENGHVVGFVTKLDVLNCFAFSAGGTAPRYDDLMKRTAADVMTPDFIYVSSSTKLTRVLQLMVEHRIRAIPVIDADQQLAGIISREDILRALDRCGHPVQ